MVGHEDTQKAETIKFLQSWAWKREHRCALPTLIS